MAAEAIPPLRRALARHAGRCGASPAVQERVALAFSEACILFFGGQGDAARGGGMLIVEARRSADGLTVRVAGSGAGLRPQVANDLQGFEVALMTHACDRVAIRRRRAGSGMEVSMTFALGAGPRRDARRRADAAPA